MRAEPRDTPDRMDAGQPEFAKVLRGLSKPAQTLRDANEAKTRIVFTDRVLGACGWPAEALAVEEPTGTGDFIDYLLADTQGQPWMIVEAKRTSRTFVIKKGHSPIEAYQRCTGKART